MLKFKNYQLIKPSNNSIAQISDLIMQNNGSIFHEVDLNRIIENTFGTELRYLVDNPSNISQAAVVHITKNKFGLKRYNLRPLYDIPYSGFIGNKTVDFNKFSVNLMESISYAGFPYRREYGKNINLGETAMVDLSLDEDEIFSRVIHSKRRNMIRKASKQGITIETYSSMNGLDVFWPILKQLHEKLGYSHLTYHYYKNIFEKYAKNKQAFVLIALRNNSPISGIFILGNPNYMHYYKGASVFGIKNEGQGELLQWEAIKLSKSIGAKYYDLCNLNKEKLPEIYRFKTGISKEIFQYQIYSQNAIGYRIANKLSKIL